MSKEIILTGLRANSEFHLGNYLGAILPVVKMQEEQTGKYQVNMFIPDLHSFTTPIDHGKLYQNTLDNLKLFVAAGLDISDADTYIYRQSYIPAHSELAWILDCFTYFGEASRMIEFKDKSKKFGNDTVSVGQFNYPVLMAADILLYGAKWVPVGEDQRQHIELTRNVAGRMNNKFGDLFILPEEWSKQLEFTNRETIRVRSLRNPDNKMSKSVEDPAGTIMLSDKPVEAAKKVMGATTDSIGSISLDWDKQPGICNLLQISALLSGKILQDVGKEWQGKSSYGALKTKVAQQVDQFLMDLRSKLDQVDEAKLLKKLEEDEEAMRKMADQKLLEVQRAVGLRPA
ncbi:MAG TPA: tryptophan--tRNA ligase [Candidatus Saccharimonadales bacterium]|nr:tryptophan--tRNA ligase [Candidatus Saccharimonadales bacterium]